jgi:two-component sensor histidine kinase
MSADVTERRRTDEHLRMVVNELNHRVRNNLAMVQSIAMQTFRRADDPEQAATRFTERLVALARANDLLTGERWTGVDLKGVLREAVSSHSEDPHGLVLDGPDVEVSAKSALALTLAAHELATNATKYGAWSVLDGTVTITWSLRTAPDGRILCVEWKERGGPIVEAPAKRGFGSRLIERGLAAELDGKVVMDFQPEGLVCRIEARLKSDGEF